MPREDEAAPSGYLLAEYAECRAAIAAGDDDRLIQVVEHIRNEAGRDTAITVLRDLLQLARNPITEPASAACIEIALQRYKERRQQT